MPAGLQRDVESKAQGYRHGDGEEDRGIAAGKPERQADPDIEGQQSEADIAAPGHGTVKLQIHQQADQGGKQKQKAQDKQNGLVAYGLRLGIAGVGGRLLFLLQIRVPDPQRAERAALHAFLQLYAAARTVHDMHLRSWRIILLRWIRSGRQSPASRER